MEKLSLLERLSRWVRRSVTLKLVIIGFLVLVLLVPAGLLQGLITEREYTRDAATREVSDKWGGPQTVGGPVISVPFRVVQKNERGQTSTTTQYAHFLPEDLKVTGTVTPEKRYRGIYVVVLYNVRLEISGSFRQPNLRALNVPPADFMLDDALLSLGISDMKGIKENIRVQWNDSTLAFNPGIATADVFPSGISVPVNLDAPTFRFSCQVSLNGSTSLHFLPLGKETAVSLQSAWADPSFEGSFLPEQRNIDAKGFSARWKVLQLNRNYPQQGIGNFIGYSNTAYNVTPAAVTEVDMDGSSSASPDNAATFGVRLLLPVDEYQKTMRSAKYSVMFIIITFVTFFFVEILNRKRIHPIQYLLVGFSICLFYVLLLSISEHLSFGYAYLIGCVTILLLVTLYARAVLKSNALAGLVAGVLAVLYGFFYSLLQLQDYALLMGSVGLLLVLAVVMYLTRNIDWYNVQREET
ncbi:MAG: cell envelope integrity protein CreD [Cytophagales bacterium]|nr:cell envelope integrity protein CreD [Cytophagales bacterium]